MIISAINQKMKKEINYYGSRKVYYKRVETFNFN